MQEYTSIWYFDLKYWTYENSILYMHYSDHSDLFKHASSQKLVPQNEQQNTYTIFLSPSAGRYEGIQNTIWNTEPLNMLFYTFILVLVLTSSSLQALKNSSPGPELTWATCIIFFYPIPKGGTRAQETSIWNTAPMNMLFCKFI